MGNNATKNGKKKYNGTDAKLPISTIESPPVIQLNDIIGLPPPGLLPVFNNLYKNALPIAWIWPCKPDFSLGLTMFTATNASDDYNDLLAKLGYACPAPLKIAFIPDSPPSDSLTNEYGESFLNKITDVASDAMGQIAYMFGAKNAGEAVKNIAGKLKASNNTIAKGIGEGVDTGRELLGSGINAVTNAIGGKGAVDLVGKMLAGNRIDFPNIWKNSGYTAATSITVRLYNPMPGNDEMHKKYIVGPLLALMCLATPFSDTPNVYSFPFLAKVVCQGLFKINPGAISSISITRGAEMQIGFNQRPSLVDVRIDFISLYSVMLNSTATDRPTLFQYKETLEDSRRIASIEMKVPQSTSDSVTISSEEDEKDIENIKSQPSSILPSETPVPRVSPEDEFTAEELKKSM